MADRYWVGGTASWDGTAGTKWSATSGGAGGESVPTAADDVFLTNLSTGTVTIAAGNTGAKSINCTGFTGTLAGTVGISVAGSVTLSAGMTYTYIGTFSLIGTGTLTTAGKTLANVTVNGAGITVTLGDALTSTGLLNLTQGTFDAAGYNVTSRVNSSNANIRTLYMRSGLWTLPGTSSVWNMAVTTNMTFDKGTADILLSDTTTASRSISPGGFSYNKLTIGGTTSTSATSIGGAATFTEIASTKTVAHTIRLGADSTTFDTWSVTGTAGNVVTLNSSVAGTRRTFNLTNVTSGIDYLAVQDIECLQADRFYVGANSTDNGNNVNVYFTASPSVAVKTIFRSVFRPVFREIFRPIF